MTTKIGQTTKNNMSFGTATTKLTKYHTSSIIVLCYCYFNWFVNALFISVKVKMIEY